MVTKESENNFIIKDNTIIDYIWKQKKITIPDKINGKKIREIGEKAFFEKGIKEVTLNSSLLEIGEKAFANNPIKKLTINDGLLKINKNAFENCHIEYLTLPKTIKEIWDFAFYGGSIAILHLPKSLVFIGKYAFANNELKELWFDSYQLIKIGKCAFAYNKIKELYFHRLSEIKEIEEGVFMDNAIKKLFLPVKLLGIKQYAFYQNPIKEIKAGGSIQYIDNMAFDVNVVLPSLGKNRVDEDKKLLGEEDIIVEKKYHFFKK